MHIEFSEEQNMLADSVEKYLRENYDFEQRQAVVKSSAGFSAERWQAFAELGWLAMTLPQELGGFEGGALETMILCEAFGRHLVIEPYFETVVLAAGLIASGGSEALKERYLSGISEGRVQGALAILEAGNQSSISHVETSAEPVSDGYQISGSKCVVGNGPAADLLLVSARTSGETADVKGISLFAVDAGEDGLTRRNYPTYDGRHACDLHLDRVVVPRGSLIGELDNAFPLLDRTRDWASLAASAEILGAMDALLRATVEYTKQRKQFGHPISRFQVLRHRMANMFIEAELTRSLVIAAAMKLDESDDEASRLVAAAKTKAGKAGRFVSHSAIQLHGGIGMTDELSVGHYFKRIAVLDQSFNVSSVSLNRYMDLETT